MSNYLPLLTISDFLPLLTILGFGGVLWGMFIGLFNLDQNDLRTALYAVFILLIGCLLGTILHFGSVEDPLNLPLLYMILQFVSLFIGVLHVWWMYKKLFWAKRDSYNVEKDSFLPEFTYTMLILT